MEGNERNELSQSLKMKLDTKVNGSQELKSGMAEDFKSGLMALSTKVTGRTTKQTARAA